MLNRFIRTAAVLAMCSAPLFAEDMKMSGEKMDKDMMMKTKEEMTSNASMMQSEMTKMMAMEKMAQDMAADADFQKMHAEMMKSDMGMKMHDEMGMKDHMMAAKQQMMSDPKAMQQVMMRAMMIDSMKNGMKMKDDMKK